MQPLGRAQGRLDAVTSPTGEPAPEGRPDARGGSLVLAPPSVVAVGAPALGPSTQSKKQEPGSGPHAPARPDTLAKASKPDPKAAAVQLAARYQLAPLERYEAAFERHGLTLAPALAAFEHWVSSELDAPRVSTSSGGPPDDLEQIKQSIRAHIGYRVRAIADDLEGKQSPDVAQRWIANQELVAAFNEAAPLLFTAKVYLLHESNSAYQEELYEGIGDWNRGLRRSTLQEGFRELREFARAGGVGDVPNGLLGNYGFFDFRAQNKTTHAFMAAARHPSTRQFIADSLQRAWMFEPQNPIRELTFLGAEDQRVEQEAMLYYCAAALVQATPYVGAAAGALVDGRDIFSSGDATMEYLQQAGFVDPRYQMHKGLDDRALAVAGLGLTVFGLQGAAKVPKIARALQRMGPNAWPRLRVAVRKLEQRLLDGRSPSTDSAAMPASQRAVTERQSAAAQAPPSAPTAQMSVEARVLYEQALARSAFGSLELKTSALVRCLPEDQRVLVSVGGSVRELTVRETLERMAQDPEGMRITGVVSTGPANFGDDIAKFDDPAFARYVSDSDYGSDLFDVQVQLASGESAFFVGNPQMLAQVARDPNVVSIHAGGSNGRMPLLIDVPAAQRGSAYDAIGALAARLGPRVSVDAREAGLLDLPIYHGTIDIYEASIREGVQNVGRGFGGRGLYVAVADERHLAETFAEMAERNRISRVQHVEEIAVDPVVAKAARAVVMQGRVRPNADLRVGRFEIQRDGPIDLENGVLPADWERDLALRRLLEERFDVLDLRGMQSNGLAIESDRFLVFHAGSERAIEWGDVVPLSRSN